MPAGFPTALPQFDEPTAPASTSLAAAGGPPNARTHVEHHRDLGDELRALAIKVGIDGSADTTTIDYRLATVEGGLAAHLIDPTDAHDASAISFVPTGTVASTDVQAAIAEVASEAAGAVSSVDGRTGVVTLADLYLDTGQNLGDVADAAASRANLGLAIGVNVQAQDGELSALAALTSAADKLPYFTGSGTAALADFTTFGRSLVDDADATAGRATLGLGTASTRDAGVAGGVATLDGSGLVPQSQIPAVAISDTFVVASQAAMLALTAQTGDVAVRSDLNKSFILKGTDPTVLGDWQELLTPTDAVLSVDGRTGVVTLSDLYQPLDGELTALAGTTSGADKVPYFTGVGTASTATLTSFGRSLIDDADNTAARSTLGLVIGSDVQAYDAELAALAGLTSAADRLPYFTGSGTASLATFTAAGRALVDDADASAQRATLGLVIGTDVQAQDAELAAIAGLTSIADRLPYFTGSGTAALATFTSFGRSLVDDADASTARTTLGLGTVATLASTLTGEASKVPQVDSAGDLRLVETKTIDTDTSGGSNLEALIRLGAAKTITAGNLISPVFLSAEATIVYGSGNPFSGGRTFQNTGTFKNPASTAVSSQHQTGFYSAPNWQGDGALFTTNHSAFLDSAAYTVINAGTGSAASHTSFDSRSISVASGWTLVDRKGVRIEDVTGAGTVTAQTGFYVPRLTKATTNTGLRCDTTVRLQNDTVTFTAAPDNIIECQGTYTMNFTGAYAQPAYAYQPTIIFQQAGYNLGAVIPFASSWTAKNHTSLTGDLGLHIAFHTAPTLTGDTNATTATALFGYNSAPTLNVANSGTLTLANHYEFNATGPAVGSGTTVTNRYAFRVQDPTGSGTVTTQYGLYVPRLTKAGTNVGLYCDTPSTLYGDTVTFTTNPTTAIITTNGVHTTNAVNSRGVNAWDFSPTFKFQQAGYVFGAHTTFNSAFTLTNTTGFTGDLGTLTSFGSNPTITGDTNATTATAITGFSYGPTLSRANSGTLTVTTLTGFNSGGTIGTGTTVTTFKHINVNELTVNGTATTQVGFDIAALAAAGTNLSVRSAGEATEMRHRGDVILGSGGVATAAGGKLHVWEATLGDPVQLLQSTATNDDPTETVYQNRVTTTDGNATVIHTVPITASRTYSIWAWIVGRRTGGSAGTADDGAAYVITGTFKTASGTVTQIGATSAPQNQESQAAYGADFNISGTNVQVRVTGATNNNMTWHATIRVYWVGT